MNGSMHLSHRFISPIRTWYLRVPGLLVLHGPLFLPVLLPLLLFHLHLTVPLLKGETLQTTVVFYSPLSLTSLSSTSFVS